ncbi:FKBP-type peptidyl-prolyl cis-trans isomerase [Vibrio neptunius]|uniref:FKBP-type peptidyl-prolyl cis-trans isomerase n=1 Tax=Vibrio neptunius TaxID=170651 RepID=UPI0019CFE6B1|nr:FKBP-type peptidyl-prolyl cis-trans isomerase [Vibrio neptunius]MBN3572160.1 FKBP-type peptidyl-prolyl cis-trans isomerase [Vibrio neptunius]QXX08627.1 FKBP-type peptidyl-prolyl cis-trans isomerase [Vibrio neptunius]
MSKIIIPIVILVLAGFMIYRTMVTSKAGEQNFAAGQAFLLENGEKEGVVTTESGLQYLVLNKGTGTVNPTAKSKVKVHYHGTLIDGTVFDSSVERGEPISFALNQVIKGWQEGLTYMVEGDKFRLFIPSPLAYGKGGSGPIPPASTLIFDVELLEIQ